MPLLWLLGAAAPLAGQQPAAPADSAPPRAVEPRRGWLFGVIGFTGGEWDPTGMEFALVRSLGARPGRHAYLGARLGSWTSDRGFVTDGTRGLFIGLAGGYRQFLLTLLEIGPSEGDATFAWLTGTLELSANKDFRSPLPDDAHATAAFLLGVAYGKRAALDQSFAVLAGPAAYIGGRRTDLRLQVGMRVQGSFGR